MATIRRPKTENNVPLLQFLAIYFRHAVHLFSSLPAASCAIGSKCYRMSWYNALCARRPSLRVLFLP